MARTNYNSHVWVRSNRSNWFFIESIFINENRCEPKIVRPLKKEPTDGQNTISDSLFYILIFFYFDNLSFFLWSDLFVTPKLVGTPCLIHIRRESLRIFYSNYYYTTFLSTINTSIFYKKIFRWHVCLLFIRMFKKHSFSKSRWQFPADTKKMKLFTTLFSFSRIFIIVIDTILAVMTETETTRLYYNLNL